MSGTQPGNMMHWHITWASCSAVTSCAGLFVYGYCFYYYLARSDMSGFMQTSFFFGAAPVAGFCSCVLRHLAKVCSNTLLQLCLLDKESVHAFAHDMPTSRG